MAALSLAQQITRAFPPLGPFAPVVAAIALLAGVGTLLAQALGNIDSDDRVQRLRALRDAQQRIRDVLTRPGTVEALDRQGLDVGRAATALSQGALSWEQREFNRASLPSFATSQEAVSFRDAMAQLYREDVIPHESLLLVVDHVDRELIRLRAGVTPNGALSNPGLGDALGTLPTFATIAEAVRWFRGISLAAEQGALSAQGVARAETHRLAEIARLAALTAPAPSLPPVQPPPVSFALPSFATVAQALAWLQGLQAAAQQGALASEDLQRAEAHYLSELARLFAAAGPGAATVDPPAGAATAQDIAQLTTVLTQAMALLSVPAASSAAAAQDAAQQLAGIKAQLQSIAQVQARPFPTTLDTPLLTGGVAALTGAVGGTGVGSLAGSLALALSGTAGPNAHNAQLARYACQGSFADPLLRVASQLLPQVFAGSVLMFSGPARKALEDLGENILTTQLSVDAIPAPASEETAQGVAVARLLQAIGFALTAQGIAYTAEAITPLKQMGFNQLAGFYGDLAGFKRLADGLMGTVENASIFQPLRWSANRRFRPTIPNEMQLALMFQKRSLTREELADYQQRLGLPDLYIDRIPGFIFNDPNPGLLIRAFQIAEPGAVTFSQEDRDIMTRANIDPNSPTAYFSLKLAKSGLDDTDVQAFVPVLQMGLLRREQTLRLGQIERLYRDGYMDRDRAKEEINLARQPASVVDYRLAAMDMQQEFEVKDQLRQLVLSAYGKGRITEAEAQENLTSLGMTPMRVQLNLLSKKVGLPVQRAEAPTITVPQLPVPAGEED